MMMVTNEIGCSRAHFGQQLIVCLISLLFIIAAAAVTTISALQLDQANNGQLAPEKQQQPPQLASSLEESGRQTSGCDRLLLANNNLAKYCQCRDADLSGPNESLLSSGGQNEDDLALEQADYFIQSNQINQLTCQPDSLDQIGVDLKLASEQFSKLPAQKSLLPNAAGDKQIWAAISSPRIDYLSIRSNLRPPSNSSSDNHKVRQPASSDMSPMSQRGNGLPFSIDHISLQLQLELQPQLQSYSQDTLQSQQSASQMIEEQMIDFGRLIDATHLQFLSIFLEAHKLDGSSLSSSASSQQNKLKLEIRLSRLLDRFANLTRVEVSLNGGDQIAADGQHNLALILDSGAFNRQAKLKWLNLASNEWLRFDSLAGNDHYHDDDDYRDSNNSPFNSTPQLEYLNFDSCNLARFPLFSLLSAPIDDLEPLNQAKKNRIHFMGSQTLISLNLASNNLTSLERDLFTSYTGEQLDPKTNRSPQMDEDRRARILNTCYNYNTNHNPSHLKSIHQKHSKVFLLSALTQLDLSRNQLSEISFKAGQLLLCSMPNLNQLYLNHNKIVHLNLNSILSAPLPVSPQSIRIKLNSSSPDDIIDTEKSTRINKLLFSRLEHLDLSHNNLIMLTAFQNRILEKSKGIDSDPSIRVRSINVGFNHLRQPLTLIDSRLINRIVFEESFDLLAFEHDELELEKDESVLNENLLNLINLEAAFALTSPHEINSKTNQSVATTFCDHLSPPSISSSSLADDDGSLLLNEIILNDNRLGRLQRKHFSSQQCKDIQILRLSGNEIAYMENEVFHLLPNLEQLDLSDNSIVDLPENIFIKNDKLRILNLSQNRIRKLDASIGIRNSSSTNNDGNIFSNLHLIEELSLANNELTHLSHSGIFAQNIRLTIVDLSNNKLVHLNESIFFNLNQLKVLNLSGNQLRSFSHHLFNIRPLNSQNKVFTSKQIAQKDSSPNKTKKQQLKLSANHKLANKSIGSRKNSSNKRRQSRQVSFSGGSTNSLNLASNSLASFELTDCPQFGQDIESLWLNQNELKELRANAFDCFPMIKQLSLHRNNLKVLDESSFHRLNQLEYLDLSHNQLSQLKRISLSPGLHHIDLSYNQLTNLKPFLIFSNESNGDIYMLEVLDVSNNLNLIVDALDLGLLMSRSPNLKQLNLANIDQTRSIISLPGSDDKQNVSTQFNGLEMREKIQLDSVNLSSIQLIDDGFSALLSRPQIGISKLDLSSTNLASSDLGALRRFKILLGQNGYQKDLLELNLSKNRLRNENLTRLLTKLVDNSSEPTNLQYLNLASNQLERWPFNTAIAAKMTKLISLDLSKNKLRQFVHSNPNDSYELVSLEVLNLSSNAIISLIESDLNHGSHHLTGKQFSNLMPSIKLLDLSHNRLTWIPTNFFDNLPQLTWLSLDYNQLEIFTLSSFSANARIFIDLSFNLKLVEISKGDKRELYNIAQKNTKDLILFSGQSGYEIKMQINCKSIDEYIAEYERKIERELSEDVGKYDRAQIEQLPGDKSDEENQIVDNERCRKLVSVISSMKVNSPSMNLNSIEFFEDKFNDLDFSRSSLSRIQWPMEERGENVVRLDVSFNKISNLPSVSPRSCANLKTLDLSNNYLRMIPNDIIANCEQLNHLDLSHNKIISSISDPASSGTEAADLFKSNRSSLLVLLLHHNQLTDLKPLDYGLFRSLRLIDLRHNRLAAISSQHNLNPMPILSFPLLRSILDNKPEINSQNANEHRPHLRLVDDNSLQIDWPSTATMANGHGGKRKLVISQLDTAENVPITTIDQSSIKFCMLNSGALSRICAQDSVKSETLVQERCFYLRVPPETPTCLTNLQTLLKTQSPSTGGLIGSNLTIPSSGNSRDIIQARTTSGSRFNDQDVISKFIDSLKSNWLKLKEFNLNEYLTSISGIENDAILVAFNGGPKIQTILALKLIIVISAICIVVLLIFLFILFTNQDLERKHANCELSSPNKNYSESTYVSDDTTETGSSLMKSSSTNTRASKLSQSSESQLTCDSSLKAHQLNGISLAHSKSTKSSSSSTNPEAQSTVQDRDLFQSQQQQQALDMSQVMMMNQHQVCSTPSSSSIETAETMQAIDSIQSAMSANYQQGSLSIKGSVTNEQALQSSSGNPTDGSQHCQPPIATVMRMVKSVSANNFGPENSINCSNHSNYLTNYRTLKNRQPNNYYSTLKSRIKSINDFRYQVHPIPAKRDEHSESGDDNCGQQQQQGAMDDSRGFMTSILQPMFQFKEGSQVLDCSQLVDDSQQQQPSNSAQPFAMQHLLDITGDPNTESHLCQFHKNHYRLLDNQTYQASSGNLVEREANQHHLQQAPTYMHHRRQDSSMINIGNLPPPPPSRAIQVMETSIHYLPQPPPPLAEVPEVEDDEFMGSHQY